jgi:hypothetical protein
MEPYEKIKASVFVGPSTWHVLKCYAANYEPSQKEEYKRLFELLLKLFPCDICREHAIANWKKHDINNYLQNKDRLYLYVSAILQDGANAHKHIPISERPNYYEQKRFIFESMNGVCNGCQNK